MRKIRVLIVDDSTVIRRLLTDALGADPAIEICGTAPNGRIALAKIPQLNPDVVTLDIEMPELDGLGTLVELRKTQPKLPVIMFSTLTERGAEATLDALAKGASDYVTKPANVGSVTAGIQAVRTEMIPKIKQFCPWAQPAPAPAPARPLPVARPVVAGGAVARPAKGRVEIVVIGVSTGGPNALATVLPKIPRDFPVPIVIVQHMPPIFTKHLADRLENISALTVKEAAGGETLRAGQIWVAPGDYHLVVAKQGASTVLRLNQQTPENSCRPAVDPLFRSAAETYGPNVLAVVLTGMGQDGQRGCEAVRRAGGRVLVQDEATSVVWGMPGAVAKAGLADQQAPLDQIANEIVSLTKGGRTPALVGSR